MGHSPIIYKPPGHHRKHSTLLVAIIGGHARVCPNQLLMLRIDLLDICIMYRLLNLHNRESALNHTDNAGYDIARLALCLKNHATTVGRSRVGAEHAEEVWEPRHGKAKISSWVFVSPG